MVKDNIATESEVCNGNEQMMQTTAGSLALVGSVVPGDAVIIRRLRNAGAVILGKTNLGEWANFRGSDIAYPLAVGWSARGGDTINAIQLELHVMGFQFGFRKWRRREFVLGRSRHRNRRINHWAIRRREHRWFETDSRPCFANGIIPISHQQDTAGPMGRSVTDVAILLNVLKSPFGRVVGQPLARDYTQFLRRGALQGARIGRDVRYFDYNYYGSGIPGDQSTVGFAEHALDVMAEPGCNHRRL